MGDRVTSISLLTAAMEINNVIGHALKETPSGIKESPFCDGMKTLKVHYVVLGEGISIRSERSSSTKKT